MTIKHKDDVSLGQNAHTVRRNTLLEQRDLLKGNIHSQVDSAVSCVQMKSNNKWRIDRGDIIWWLEW